MVTKMITAITEALSGVLSGVGSAIVDFFDTAVIKTGAGGETELTTFAIWALAFLGISFGLGVVKFITNLVRR